MDGMGDAARFLRLVATALVLLIASQFVLALATAIVSIFAVFAVGRALYPFNLGLMPWSLTNVGANLMALTAALAAMYLADRVERRVRAERTRKAEPRSEGVPIIRVD
jgi:uncharacterized membrane protein YfcA